MSRIRSIWPVGVLAGTAFLAWLSPVPAARAQDVQIYRCAVGKTTVTQDKPCKPGQEVSRQSMTRPRDPAKPAVISPTRISGVAERNVTYVIRQDAAARPLYRCTTPDGDSYTSESGEGLARWVPAYGTWVGPGHMRPPMAPVGGGASVRYRDRHTSVQIGGGYLPPPVYGPPVAVTGGYWLRDSCAPLPQAQVCALLTERRAEIRRLNVARQASERDALDAEAAGIDARLRADCP